MDIVTKSPRVETTYGEAKPVYFVMVEGGQSPKRRHTSRYSATKEAERLAALNPGIPFNVVKLKQTMAVNGPSAPAPERVLDAADEAPPLGKDWFKRAQKSGGIVEEESNVRDSTGLFAGLIDAIRQRVAEREALEAATPPDPASYAVGRGIKDKTEIGIILHSTMFGNVATKAIKTRNDPEDETMIYAIFSDDPDNEERSVNASRVVPIE